GSSCGEPQFLMKSLVSYVDSKTHRIYGSQIIHVWTLGVAPYAEKRFAENFRHNSFFISDSSRETVRRGLGDYTPAYLSEIPLLFRQRRIHPDVALVQVSLPDSDGNMSLGVSVDIVKAAVECADLVVAQVNANMPCVYGESLIGADMIDFLVHHDEPLLVYDAPPADVISGEIGRYVARIVRDGDTLQVGYGAIPNSVIASLKDKKDLGIHTELLGDGIVDLMRAGVVTNAKKSLDRGKSVASFCMGSADTYAFIDNNDSIEFRPIDYTNSPMVIGRQENITAINTALQIDLSGQSTAESLGTSLYSGIGGHVDFMRGAALAPGGKTILTMRSTSNDGMRSRIVPVLDTGASATLGRGDVRYVVTEYGIAYLHGKNLRERALSLITIAHPKFRKWLHDEARRLGLIAADHEFIEGEAGEYRARLEAYRKTASGLNVFLRPVKMSDLENLRKFFYSLSDKSLYTRFFADIEYVPQKTLERYCAIDYSKELIILVLLDDDGPETVIGIGQYVVDLKKHTAEISLVVRDDYQDRGVGTIIIDYLVSIGIHEGILEMTFTVMRENGKMLRLTEKTPFAAQRTTVGGTVYITIPLG
ncbi:MAG TPA: GNAT family N-acetyltransferase, partial [Spirochaetota bacterium]|nr:GNAT family N-acetyltransferase [Spirochaetota bacterium]